jgi:hypothetical protein
MKDTVLLVTNNVMGNADEKPKFTLISKYLSLLLESESLPSAIGFYTEGVRLVCEGSPVLEPLHALETQKARVGIVGSTVDVLEAQMNAEKAITL